MTKKEIVARIAHLIDVTPPPMSTGSTEPAAIFTAVLDRLGLVADPGLDKVPAARAIVAATGRRWLPHYESSGATVTRSGLRAVLKSVEELTAR